MQELIEKLIKRLENEKMTCESAKAEALIGMNGVSASYYDGEKQAYDKAVKIVEKISSEYNDGWIPLTADNTPEEEQVVDITFRNSAGIHVGEATYKKEKFFYVTDTAFGYYEERYESVLAWRPRPKAYSLSKDGEEKKKLQKIMRELLKARGYEVTEKKLIELYEIYEDSQECDDNGMLMGKSREEIEDFIEYSPCVDEIFHSEVCDWEYDNVYLRTSCGESIKYRGADWKYCPFCGKKIFMK